MAEHNLQATIASLSLGGDGGVVFPLIWQIHIHHFPDDSLQKTPFFSRKTRGLSKEYLRGQAASLINRLPQLMNKSCTAEAPPIERIRGLDSIRFLCAFMVLLGHFGLPLPDALGPDATGFYKLARGILSCLFNGPAAVIVFFVISGFCIHFPQRADLRMQLGPYFCRRLLRIGIPVVIAMMLSFMLGDHLAPPYFGVLWSIICELVYYLLYPLLLVLRRSFGWTRIIAASSLLAVLWWATHVREIHEAKQAYAAFGYMTWLNGLPCWLLGCWLAENLLETDVVSSRRIWAWRALVVGLSIALRIVKFHATSIFASNCITLNFFAFVICCWLRVEIAYRRKHPPSSILEWSGQWSYSLYLTHPEAPKLAGMLLTLPLLSTFKGWSCLMLVSLVVAYAFFLLVESPSQKLAKFLSARLNRRKFVSH